MNKIAIIGSGYMAGIIAKRASEIGVESFCFGLDENKYMTTYITKFYKVDIFDITTICDICKKNEINGIIATTELTILPTAKIAKNLNLNGNNISVAQNITDKLWVRKKAENIDRIKQPNFFVCDEYINMNLTKFPVIVKPTRSGGKRGINVVYEKEKLEDAVKEAINNSKNNIAIIEEFIYGGNEYSVESISYKGEHFFLQVTEKISSGPPHCVELGHHQPANITSEMREKIEIALKELFTKCGIENGPCHTEIKIVEDDIYLIEVNARPGGDSIAYPLTELSTGYPYITSIICCATKTLKPINIKKFKKNYCGILFVTKQTKELQEIFENCDNESWLYKKNKVSEELQEITHNDGFNINYMIYLCKDKKPSFLKKGEEENE